MQPDLKDLSVSELYAKLNSIQLSIEADILAGCAVVVELRRRGETPHVSRDGAFHWALQVVQGKLHPSVAYAYASDTVRIYGLTGMPLDRQERLMRGETVTVCVPQKDGTFKAVEQSIYDMEQSVFIRVFGDGMVRTFTQQKKWWTGHYETRRTHRVAAPTAIRVDKATEEVVIGQLRLSATELAVALGELGFKVTRRIRVAAVTVETPVQRAA